MMFDIVLTLVFAIGVNMLMFIPAYFLKTDKLTDISYAVSFFLVALYGLLVGGVTTVSVILFVMVALWAIRLGSYLLIRINKIGKDKRFDGMRESFFRFGRFWFFQGLTVWVVLLSSLLFFFGENDESAPLCLVVGVVVFLAGLLIEGFADYQKYTFINTPENKGKWIDTGLWKYSRHPNYFGEMLVWIGVYIFTLSSLTGWFVVIGLASPLYIIAILMFFSGVPMLEKGADKRWGADPQYQEYKRKTSLLVLLPRKK